MLSLRWDKETQTLKETVEGGGFNLSLKQKKTLSPPSLIPVSDGVSICHRLKMKEIESKGVASDQINGGSLMRFVKQHRSRSLGVQSRLSNLGLRGDRNYWSKVLLEEKKIPPLSPWFLRFNCSIYFTLPPSPSRILCRKKKYIHTHTHTAALHPEWMSFSQISVLFVLCPFTQTGPQSLSLLVIYPLCPQS